MEWFDRCGVRFEFAVAEVVAVAASDEAAVAIVVAAGRVQRL